MAPKATCPNAGASQPATQSMKPANSPVRPTPSRADIQVTKSIIDIAGPLGISVHDHIIVGKMGMRV